MTPEVTTIVIAALLAIGACISIPAAIWFYKARSEPFSFLYPKRRKERGDPRFDDRGVYGERKVIAELEEQGRWK